MIRILSYRRGSAYSRHRFLPYSASQYSCKASYVALKAVLTSSRPGSAKRAYAHEVLTQCGVAEQSSYMIRRFRGNKVCYEEDTISRGIESDYRAHSFAPMVGRHLNTNFLDTTVDLFRATSPRPIISWVAHNDLKGLPGHV